MEELKQFVHQYKEIIVAVIVGACGIIAALIKKEKSPQQGQEAKPIRKLVILSLFSMVLGAILLAAEVFVIPVDPAMPLGSDNPGSIVLLAGCLLVAAGVIWGFINLIRLNHSHKKDKALASTPVNSSGGSVSIVQPVAKRRP